MDVKAPAGPDLIDQARQNPEAATDGNVLQDDVAVDKIEVAQSIGEFVVGKLKTRVIGPVRQRIRLRFRKHRRRDIKRNHLREFVGQRQGQPTNAATMIQRPVAPERPEQGFAAVEQVGNECAAGGEKFVVVARNLVGAEFFMRKNAEVGVLGSPLLP